MGLLEADLVSPKAKRKMSENTLHEPGAGWRLTPQVTDPSAPAATIQRGSRPSDARVWRPLTVSAIRALAQRIVDRFQPEKVILFGSYAYGNPRPESDVDLLVIMETTLRSRQQRLEISQALSPRPFPLDIVVRTPQEVAQRLALGDAFLAEILSRGKVLYERNRG